MSRKLPLNPVKIVTAVSPMRLLWKIQESQLEILRWLSELYTQLRCSLAGASDAIRWDIDSAIKNVKCMTWSV